MPELLGVIIESRATPREIAWASAMKMPFGRYRGRTLGAIVRDDPDWFRWLGTSVAIESQALREAVDVLWQAHGASLGPREVRA